MRKTLPFHFRWGAILVIALILSKPAMANATEVLESAGAEVKAEVTIKGKITDQETGEPLPGVTVLEKGTSNGTISDFNGEYKITVNNESTLVFSFVGYSNQEMPVGGSSIIDVSLTPDVQALEEIVVIGYGEVKRADVTGSVVSMDSKKIAAANKIDAVSSIQGQLPGVVIQRTDNKPGGGGFNIRIRGASTINNNETAANGGYTPGQNPLFIVDGMFVSDISFMNPSDIERMDVLKDASATAIYGSRGSNGVVIIQTKKGSTGKLNVRYSNYVGVKQAYHLPSIMDAPTYVEYLKDVVVGNVFANPQGDLSYRRSDVNVNDFLSEEEQQYVADGVNTNWVDMILQNGFQTNHTVDLSGGKGATVYGFGLGYTKDNGNIAGEDFTRYTLRGNIKSEINKWLTLGYNSYVTAAIQNTGSWEAFRSAYRLKPIGNPYNEDGSLKFYPIAKETQITNPLFEPDNSFRETKYLQYLSDISVEIKPMENLSITSRFSPNVKFSRYGEYRALWSKETVGNTSLTRAQVNNGNYFTYTWDNILNYNFNINEKNRLNATLVYSRFLDRAENYYLQTRGFTSDTYLFYNVGAGTVNSYSSDFSRQTLESYTARFNYALADKYLLTVTGRYDGASILAEGNKWAFFPSAALAWRISEESFLKSISVVSDAKVRLSYGQTGNTGQGGGLAPLKTQSLLAPSTTSLGSTAVATSYITGLANQDLTWERMTEFNFGLDYGILKNRVYGSLDIYNRQINGIIFELDVPYVTGYAKSFDNIGEASNKGVELTLNSVNIERGDFRWTTNFNFARNKNEIKKLYGNRDQIIFGSYVHQVGNPIGSLYDYEFDGIWQMDEATAAAEVNQRPGQVKVVDQNGDGKITTDDRTIIGQVTPKWTGGLTNTMNYKNFDFTFMVYTSQGNKMLSNFHTNLSFPWDGDPNRLFNAYDVKYWTPENPINTWYQPGNGGQYQNAIKYKDVSFTKVGYITLGYTLPASILNRVKVSNLRIYATVQNPFIVTKYDGWDPENASRNAWGAAFMSRTYMTGLNLSF